MSLARPRRRGGRGARCALLLALSPFGCSLPAPAGDAPPDCLSIDRAQALMAESGLRHVATLDGLTLAAPVAMFKAVAPGAEMGFDVAMVFDDPRFGGGALVLARHTCVGARAFWPARLWPSVRRQILGEPT